MNVTPLRPQAQHAPVRILVVDDDAILRAMAEAALVEDQAEVVQAVDGLEALEIVETQAFDLMLLDLEMPRLDGFDVLKAIRASEDVALRELPVIVTTGRKDLFAIEQAYARGATSFITKPILWPLLRHHIRFVMRAAQSEKILGVVRAAVA